MNILVIEDEREIVAAIQEALQDQGHLVSAAAHGVHGLACLDCAPPGGFQLILLDLMMPVMDGEAFLAALSERQESRSTSVVVMTASRRIPTSKLPVQILRKPLELGQLLEMVERVENGRTAGM